MGNPPNGHDHLYFLFNQILPVHYKKNEKNEYNRPTHWDA